MKLGIIPVVWSSFVNGIMSYAEKGLLGNKDGYRETKRGGYAANVSTFIGRSTLHGVVVLGGA